MSALTELADRLASLGAAATPGPLFVGGDESDTIYTETSQCVGHLHANGIADAEGSANAYIAVILINAHEQIVAALRLLDEAGDILADAWENHDVPATAWLDDYRALCAALAGDGEGE